MRAAPARADPPRPGLRASWQSGAAPCVSRSDGTRRASRLGTRSPRAHPPVALHVQGGAGVRVVPDVAYQPLTLAGTRFPLAPSPVLQLAAGALAQSRNYAIARKLIVDLSAQDFVNNSGWW